MSSVRPAGSPGLTTREATARLARDGANVVPAPGRISPARRLLRQLVHFFALLLWVASVLAAIAGLPELAIAIVLVVLVNAVFAFVQEGRADRAADRLRSLLPRRVTVRRDGMPVEIEAEDVVSGDVLLLVSGDRIPADATVHLANALRVDMSSFTGESEPVAVDGGTLYAGTFVSEGDAEALVIATGSDTRLAGLALMTIGSPSPVSPLTRELHRVVRTVALVALAIGLGFFGLTLLQGREPADGLVLAIGVTVALVPEALLPTVTLSLAWGAEQMARRNVLVRELDAVETLGSTTFICTDKTGTLTMNQMSVVEAWTPAGATAVVPNGYDPTSPITVATEECRRQLAELAREAARCSTGSIRFDDGDWRAHGDPMEASIDAFAQRLGVDTAGDRAEAPSWTQFPFDPHRKRMSVVVPDAVLVKGAPESVIPRCARVVGVEGALGSMTDRGLRVLAVASRPVQQPPGSAEDAEQGLDLLGLLAFEDPPRPGVHAALAACRRGGIRVAMITGDHPATAAAIATQIDLRSPDGPVLIGDDLPPGDEELGVALDVDGLVVARVSPEDKVRIARVLRKRGHVVAMTGDGVNDAPALHEADIGIAMGRSGTDVAREAADLVLLDDDFASIVRGVEQGRATFANIRRFLTYHLTDNVAELTPFVIWALSGGSFPLALGVLQILALDLGTDTLSAVALGAEPPDPAVLSQPPVTGRLLDRTVVRRAFGLFGPIVAGCTMLAFVTALAIDGWRPGDPFPTGSAVLPASGAAFMAVVFAQSANAFACRSFSVPPWKLGWRSNRLLVPAVAIELVFSVAVLLVVPIAAQLEHEAPPTWAWIVIGAAPLLVLAADALDKRIRRSPEAESDPP